MRAAWGPTHGVQARTDEGAVSDRVGVHVLESLLTAACLCFLPASPETLLFLVSRKLHALFGGSDKRRGLEMAAAKTHANVEVKNVGETRGSTIACPVSPHTRSSTERGMPDASLSLSTQRSQKKR
jgi:hypothetical protein